MQQSSFLRDLDWQAVSHCLFLFELADGIEALLADPPVPCDWTSADLQDISETISELRLAANHPQHSPFFAFDREAVVA